MKAMLALMAALILLTGCAALSDGGQQRRYSTPMLEGWYEDQKVYYITTDVSEPDMAATMHANYAPRLADAIPPRPKPPGRKTVLERVYLFPNGEQSRNVFASIPSPVGPESRDTQYSPIWIVWTVEWLAPNKVQVLRSEEGIFQAEDKGWIKLTPTQVVVNCPIVGVQDKGFLTSPEAFAY